MESHEVALDAQLTSILGPVFDRERRVRARTYARLRRLLTVAEVSLSLVYLLLWVVTPAARSLGSWAVHHAPGRLLAALLAFLVVGSGLAVIDLLFGLLSHALERRYGLSTQGWEAWLTDWVKIVLIEGGLGAVAVVGIMYLASTGTPLWWLWGALAGAVVLLVLMVVAPVFIAPLFFHFEPLTDEALRQRFLALAERAGVPVVDVYRFDLSTRTRAANAAVVGLGKTRRIIVGDTLLTSFTPEEAETILAHELAHHVHRDILLSFLLEGVMLLLVFRVLAWLVQKVTGAWQVTPDDPALVPVVLLTFFLMQLLLSPLLNLWSRTRESLADMFAVVLTGQGRTYARALARLADQNLADLFPPTWYVWIFGSHPPLGERIAMALAYDETTETKEESTHEPTT